MPLRKRDTNEALIPPSEAGEKKPKKHRFLKLSLLLSVFGFLILGGYVVLLKLGVVKPPKVAALQPLIKRLGLNSPRLPARQVAVAPMEAPLGREKQALEAQRKALEEDRKALEKEKADLSKAMVEEGRKKEATASPDTNKSALSQNLPDPKSLARMAMVYEEMPLEKASKIFAILPDTHALALFRRMDAKRVAELLAADKPARAARFSQELSKAENRPASAP
jgi:flagellar motility protein MotE (MotC chaperone)